MPQERKKSYVINFIGVLIVFLLLLALFESNLLGSRTNYIKGICTTACYTIIMVASLNLLTGFMGEFSLGHAGFMSVGAYASAIATGFLDDSGCLSLYCFCWRWQWEELPRPWQVWLYVYLLGFGEIIFVL